MSFVPSRFMLDGVFALRGPAQRRTTTSMLPRLLLSSVERAFGVSCMNSVSHQLSSPALATQLTLAKPFEGPFLRNHRTILLPLFLLTHAEVHQ